ncbi:condensation domain-containing protein [Labedaea rhizosphaerae]|uniref:Condensation domain-containing protein n=1 Tax=Labedaea rhizosphaerae TaxID=598644 RepID=A0A4R6SFS9_LABRH|nr:condensation domain-containing protein [Labedaea rhizosphaerae]TDQ00464.1 condensation domain-containing protein [Labedaea rhizosphaerae]
MSARAVREADLCWGQRYHWLRYLDVPEHARHDVHIVVRGPLPEGVTTAALRTALTMLVRRHEALRTVYDAQAHPWPRQRVLAPAPVPLHEATTDDDGTPGPAAVVRELTVRNFDLAEELPARACVVTTGGVPRQLVLVLNHIAFDDWSIDAFRKELTAVLTAMAERRPAALAPVTHQPVDLAAHDAARPRASVAAALEHWRAELAALPADVFATRRRNLEAGDTTAYSAALTSPGLLPIVRDIAGRHNTWTSAVHLAAYVAVFAAYTGAAVIAPQWLTSHREAGPHMSVLTCMFSPALVPVAVDDDPSFSVVLARVIAATEAAKANANVPYDEIIELTAAESFRRGQLVRTASELNFLNYAPRSCGVRRDRFAWNAHPAEWAEAGTDTYTRVWEWQDGVTLGLTAMATVMDANAVEQFLRGYVELLALHEDPAVDLTVGELAAKIGFAPAGGTSGRTALVGGDLVDLTVVEQALCAHPSVRAAVVALEEAGLVARIAAAAPVTPVELRGLLLDAMHDRPGVRCPDLFVVDGADPVSGNGFPAEPRPAATDAEHALAKAVAEVNELDVVDTAVGYLAAGGRLLRLPRVLSALRTDGWGGITVRDLSGLRPLTAVADRLSRDH